MERTIEVEAKSATGYREILAMKWISVRLDRISSRQRSEYGGSI